MKNQRIPTARSKFSKMDKNGSKREIKGGN